MNKEKDSIRKRAFIYVTPTRVWRSRISWRMTLSIFLTVLIVQSAVVLYSFALRHQTLLSGLSDAGQSAISPALRPSVPGILESPIEEASADRILSSTPVRGFSVYSANYALLGHYGDPVSLVLSGPSDLGKSYSTENGDLLETSYKINNGPNTYLVAARLDSANIAPDLAHWVQNRLTVLLLTTGFVTAFLMISLSRWLLEPFLFLRDNLMAASKNPENPDIVPSPFDPQDDIGAAIDLTQKLIRQNAENIRQIKSTAEDKIHRLAYYDTLTGLPNRTLFLQKLNEQARKATDSEGLVQRFAVIALDLDHFKDINDTMGHNVGDAILRGVGKRLLAALPQGSVVARTGEDEFAITTPLPGEMESARRFAERLVIAIRSEPFKVFNEAFQVRASIGVSTFPDDAADPDQVLKNADIALNRAKEEGRDTIKEYSEDFDRVVQQRFLLLRDLRDALEREELMLYYQPQFELHTGHLIGAEALLRWFRKDSGKQGGHFISPAEFIPVAEQSGLIVPLGEWVLRTACKTAQVFQEAGLSLRVAINVSGAQFYQSDIVSYVEKCLNDFSLEPHRIELEVTESVFMEDISVTIETLQKLHALGVELAIDDFGTGYSSLSYLRQFPIDRLKIDQSFIRNALNNADDASIARTIVRLGHSLNLKVIAEGVETLEHETFLRQESCDEVQGFRYSKPIPEEDFHKFVQSYRGDFRIFDK